MIKDCINNLEGVYKNIQKKEIEEVNNMSERDNIMAYTDSLLQGIKPRVYKPLLKRETCCKLKKNVNN